DSNLIHCSAELTTFSQNEYNEEGKNNVMAYDELLIKPFEPNEQVAVRRLILEGLGGHFGYIDETLNPDLTDIMASYIIPGNVFLVAYLGSELVGTGALIPEKEDIGRVVRVSTDQMYRRKGIATTIMRHLLNIARQRGYRRVVISTNNGWEDAIGLYKYLGFIEEARNQPGVSMALDLRER